MLIAMITVSFFSISCSTDILRVEANIGNLVFTIQRPDNTTSRAATLQVNRLGW